MFFLKKSLPEIKESDEDGYRTGTNFILGYDGGETASVYRNGTSCDSN